MGIQLIWAQEINGGIGKNGKLPWHISEDLKNFKKITKNHPIIMGRITWESLPFKPLPNRRNIVISSTNQEQVESYKSIEECIESLNDDKEVLDMYIIGGMSVYKFFYNHADILHITFINRSYPDTDTFFPISFRQIKSDFNLESKDDISDELSFTVWTRK